MAHSMESGTGITDMTRVMDLVVDYSTAAAALIVFNLLMLVLFSMKKTRWEVLRAKLFLDVQFFARTIYLVITVSVLLPVHIFLMHTEQQLAANTILLFALLCLGAIGFLWYAKFKEGTQGTF